MNVRVMLICIVLSFSGGCSTMNGAGDAHHPQSTGSMARGSEPRTSSSKAANQILSIPFKVVGVVTAGVGLLLVELATNDIDYNSHSVGDDDEHDTDVGLALTGLGLALGGGFIYEFGDAISKQ